MDKMLGEIAGMYIRAGLIMASEAGEQRKSRLFVTLSVIVNMGCGGT